MRTVLSRVKIKGGQIVIVVLFMLAMALAEMFLPTLLARMIDVGVANSDRGMIVRMAIIMAVIAAVAGAAGISSNRISSKIATKFAADLRREIFDQVQSFAAPEMDRFGTASLVTRSTSDVDSLQRFFIYLMRLGLMAPLMAIAGLALSAITGGKVSVVLTIAIPVLLVACTAIILVIIRLSDKLRMKVDELNALSLETLEGVRVIRAFNKQPHEIKRFDETNKQFAKINASNGRATGLLVPVIQIVFGLTSAAVMSLGAYYVIQGEMEVGTLVANSQYINMILMAIILLTLVIVYFPMAYTCAKRIEAVLNTKSSIVDGDAKLEDRTSRGVVEFNNVTFAYPGASAPVLKDLNFSAHPGEFVAIVGRTGSGKSSLVKLIPRCYDVTFGQVKVDGIDVRDYNQKDLRSLIGYVPQKNVLFSGDIAYNLNFGDENGDDRAWKEAADISCASEFIEAKKEGYHAPIAQGGTNLSGGQRQRMAIARAVMRHPEIYIFDDSFSALDVKTDKQLRTNIREKCGDATVIMVAQRISSIVDANRILVLENNQIVGDGTHKELLKTCPLYREIAVLQMGEEAVKREEA